MSAALHPAVLTPPRRAPSPARRLTLARALDIAVILAAAAAALALVLRANTVLGHRWNWSVIATYLVRIDPATGAWSPNLLLTGLFTTIRLAIWSLLLGTILGTIVAAMRLSGRPAFRWLARIFVEIVRNTPPIVLIFVFYFFVSSQITPLLGLDAALRAAPAGLRTLTTTLLAPPERINDLLSGLACLSLLAAAYMTEIIRAGIQSIPHSQVEAAQALGLHRWATFRTVILPPALRNVLPAFAGQFIVSIKDSALVSLISIQELTFATSEVSSTTNRFFETWLFTAAVYFTLCFTCSLGFRALEYRWRR